jgi:thiol-disulfide isomerase/thioredoxin
MSSSNLLTIDSPEQFKDVLSRDLNKVSVLDFWATWAQPCEKMNEVVREASEKYKDVLFLMVSVVESDWGAAGCPRDEATLMISFSVVLDRGGCAGRDCRFV